ncbi:MAG: hypothetical protein WBK95_04065 [Sulfurimonas sp.]|jgi:hypothetical protein|nr:hypothetical protein [Sulfurimonas sp.]MDD5202143.1 hypothetical protein [Sulfurimonas sp.]
MKEYIEIFTKNQEKIESFIEETLDSVGTLYDPEDERYKRLYKTFPSLELIYVVCSKTKEQVSANIYRNKIDIAEKGKDRSYLLDRLKIKENGFAFAQPYQSSATSNVCITVSKKEGAAIIFMDLQLEVILERLGLIEKHKIFSSITRTFYLIAGYFMMFLSGVAIFYAAHDFVNNLLDAKLSIDTIFKPIIAATLGLAIFDLAKTILEQEVYFKSYVKDSKIEIKTLTKFLVTILIALSIETLMVVFKIAIENYDKMVNALYLMTGTSMFIVSLAFMIYITKKK